MLLQSHMLNMLLWDSRIDVWYLVSFSFLSPNCSLLQCLIPVWTTSIANPLIVKWFAAVSFIVTTFCGHIWTSCQWDPRYVTVREEASLSLELQSLTLQAAGGQRSEVTLCSPSVAVASKNLYWWVKQHRFDVPHQFYSPVCFDQSHSPHFG